MYWEEGEGCGYERVLIEWITVGRPVISGGGLWIHMAIPGLGGRDTSRDFWFSISGDPYGGGTRE